MTLWSELSEQPETLERVVERNRVTAAHVARTVASEGVTHVIIAARGTSDNAARYAQYVWGGRNRLSVGLAAPSLFGVYHTPPRLEGALVVAISQSGQSPDLLAVLEEATTQGRPTVAITNDPASPLARAAGHIVDLCAGEERAVAATKTYTAQLGAVAVVSAALSPEPEADRGLATLPEHAHVMLAQSARLAEIAAQHTDLDVCVVLGRGYNHATAFEWALKLQELAYVLAQPFSTADFLHGPIALVDEGFPVLAVAPTGPPLPDVRRLLQEMTEERKTRLVVISNDPDTLALTEHGVALPEDMPEWLTPLAAIIAGQLFTYHLTVAKGLDPDRPRGLTKVTRTK